MAEEAFLRSHSSIASPALEQDIRSRPALHMWSTCAYLSGMSKMIQIRNVSDELHAELRRRAAKQGLTLTAYLERVLEREVARPLPEEVFERIAARPSVELDEPVAAVVRLDRPHDHGI